MMQEAAAARYAKALQSSNASADLVCELLQSQVCARCCMRLAGVRTSVYAEAAPSNAELVRALRALGSQSCAAPCGSDPGAITVPDSLAPGIVALPASTFATSSTGLAVPAQHSACPHNAQEDALATGHQNGAAPQPAASAAEHTWAGSTPGLQPPDVASNPKEQPECDGDPPCCICLGILQSLDGPLEPMMEPLMAAASKANPSPGTWRAVERGSTQGLREVFRKEGMECTSFATSASFPGAVLVRQRAMQLHVSASAQHCPPTCWPARPEGAVDVKEAVRLGCGTALADALGLTLDREAPVVFALQYIHPDSAAETDFLARDGGAARQHRGKRQRQEGPLRLGRAATANLVTSLAAFSEARLHAEACVPPRSPAQRVRLAARLTRGAVHVAGCYRKLTRDVSNSPFFVGGVRLGRTSVQEEVERVVLPPLRCDASKFISAGREDLDVRMLGDGRPFVLEIANTRAAMPSRDRFEELQDQLNAAGVGVEVLKLQPVGRDVLAQLKAGEAEKQKTYEALCRLPVPVTPAMLATLGTLRDIVLQQTTPARVAHRRALLVRARTVHEMSGAAEAGDPHLLRLRLRTQAGTYIKEFVHGDEGRTTPHLSQLLELSEPSAILELDVLQIHMDFL